jgi:2-pyrone-4,6-dicarboxylate lactonase
MLGTEAGRICLPPKPPTPPKYLAVPNCAWDCHAHVIGQPPRYPFIASRRYTPMPAPVQDFIAVLDMQGIRYGVAVQVSVHGDDNGYLLKALRENRDRLVGVAVIDETTPDRTLIDMKAAGIAGIRLLEAEGGIGTDGLERLDARCAELGWHIQLCTRGHRYPDLLPRLVKLRSPLVIDHMGWFSVEETVSGAGFQAVLEILRDANSWVKISGGFRLSKQGVPYLDTVPFMKVLLNAAPNRLIWGSDWPHVGIVEESAMPQYGDLLDIMSMMTGDETLVSKIFVNNPAKLYGHALANPLEPNRISSAIVGEPQ